ncbi:MAG: NAD(P)/FAD-dependent oxidoreductase [Nitrososphaerota archaeon]|jgi:geranylgeranyl reductase family protein|uniref:NAD(P)/FAD-dependent oxidoreductase n=1 Tax=Candidatus Bathycorpusculum sp. TaxID=2994959 RepID=UPI00282802DD|nr:NAD(P)/FAD-dependent oxidoreductase [Candidatus Termitimicrobium sp.]MCL2432722.1 NAD(P)/FAD-dependent oxidoreductase [Candidatus Termitimicrobium sp.]MDR0493250.1 NAD(P)/FAD-dependent oxidoreductase [Nitrososphaerota archaeon]
MENYDAIVVGAGTAGCLAAKTIAEKGLKVTLIEKSPKEIIGEKICGDAIGEHHLTFLGLEKPTGGELETKIDGIKIFSPDEKTVFTIADKDFIGYILNRHLFGQWLLKKAIDKGALLQDNTNFRSPIIEKGAVTGILAKNTKTGKVTELHSKVVVDATGYFAMVRKQLPAEFGIERDIANEDVEACYREIRQLKQETQDTRYCEIYLNQKTSPGGYVWIFPKGGARVNVGIGTCMRKTGYPNPKEQLYKTTFTKPMFNDSTVLTGGAWFDPVRRPIDNMVGNGVVLVGDAASLVNPIHGGGIGPSMLSGYFAGQQIVEAIEKGEPTKAALWNYNKKYMDTYGKKQGTLDIFKMFLLSCNDEDLNYGMNEKIMTEDDVLKAGMGDDFHLNITETAKRVFRGIRRVGFLNKLRLTVTMMRGLGAHYNTYPATPQGFEAWQIQTIKLIEEGRQKLLS